MLPRRSLVAGTAGPFVAVALSVAAACSAPAPNPAAPAPAAAAVAVDVPADTAGAPATLLVPADAGQIVLRLMGDTGEPSDLMLEIAPADAPDEARRWAVDAAPAGADGAHATVTLPGYALGPGLHHLTLWRGDAEVVRRQTVRVARP